MGTCINVYIDELMHSLLCYICVMDFDRGNMIASVKEVAKFKCLPLLRALALAGTTKKCSMKTFKVLNSHILCKTASKQTLLHKPNISA